MTEPVASSTEIYGRLKEGAHFAGYSFERACTHLEWLLEGDRWMLGGQYGDVILKMPNGSLATIECKAEEEKSPNIFFEVYSNLVGSVRNHYSIANKAGWGYTSQATFLLYHFLEDDTLLVGDMLRFKLWAFGYWRDGKWVAGQLFRMDEERRSPAFIERPQGKRPQLNNTVGRLVPWRILIKECRMTRLRVGQGELFPVDFPKAA